MANIKFVSYMGEWYVGVPLWISPQADTQVVVRVKSGRKVDVVLRCRVTDFRGFALWSFDKVETVYPT